MRTFNSIEIEFAKSDRARCRYCGKKIGKGIPRAVWGYYYHTHWEKGFICYRCTPEVLKSEMKTLKEIMIALKKGIKKRSAEIILHELKQNEKEK